MAFVAKQPNGLYCTFSAVLDCPTHWNMTAEDYIELCKQQAEEEARFVLEYALKPFEKVKNDFLPQNMTRKEFEAFLQEVGDSPRKPQKGGE